jgi:hypothetical protein
MLLKALVGLIQEWFSLMCVVGPAYYMVWLEGRACLRKLPGVKPLGFNLYSLNIHHSHPRLTIGYY